MADQWTHIHIFLRQRMMGGTLFERCICGRARSPVMTTRQALQAQVAAQAVANQATASAFNRIYGRHLFELVPSRARLTQLEARPVVRPSCSEVPPAMSRDNGFRHD